jgi:plastocyanin
MSRRTLRRTAVPGLAMGAAVVAVAPAAALGPATATLPVKDGAEFKANRYIKDKQRFGLDRVSIRPGGTLTIDNKTGEEHTFSLVKRSQVPGNLKEMGKCFEGGVCAKIGVSHGAINPDTGEEQEPTTPLVNVGKDGFNQPGDSVVFKPRSKTKVKVTARKGQTLSFICAIHPWMQGKLDVE